jgi:hypothetical protein
MLATLWQRFRRWTGFPGQPEHLRRGRLGERAARRHLRRLGLRFLTANFRSSRGEIDLIFREGDGLKNVSFAMNIWPSYIGRLCHRNWRSVTCGSAPQGRPTAIRSGAKQRLQRRTVGRWG